tara:strand:- start:1535 stop:2398 length:864 start_codon:yes stop_codon:yes gene_type:complete
MASISVLLAVFGRSDNLLCNTPASRDAVSNTELVVLPILPTSSSTVSVLINVFSNAAHALSMESAHRVTARLAIVASRHARTSSRTHTKKPARHTANKAKAAEMSSGTIKELKVVPTELTPLVATFPTNEGGFTILVFWETTAWVTSFVEGGRRLCAEFGVHDATVSGAPTRTVEPRPTTRIWKTLSALESWTPRLESDIVLIIVFFANDSRKRVSLRTPRRTLEVGAKDDTDVAFVIAIVTANVAVAWTTRPAGTRVTSEVQSNGRVPLRKIIWQKFAKSAFCFGK